MNNNIEPVGIFKYIYYDEKHKKYQVKMLLNNEFVNFGSFTKIQHAIKLRNEIYYICNIK